MLFRFRSLMITLPMTAFLAFGMSACATESEMEPAAGETEEAATAGNPITGEGIPNPTSTVIENWGDLPEGREWGSTAGIDIDPHDGQVWAYERCGAGNFGGGVAITCDSNPVDPIFKFDRNTGEVLANFGGGIMVTPHGIHLDADGNVWVTDFAGNEAGTKGHQVHKFSPTGELLLSLGTAGQAGSGPNQLNQPNDVITGPDGSIYVSDGHGGQGMTTRRAMAAGLEAGATARILKFSADGTFIKEWGQIGTLHGEFRTPHALAFDSQGRLFVADRGNHRIEIFDQDGEYLESRYSYGRISGLFITGDDMLYAIDSESSMTSHQNWKNGVRIGHVDEDRITGYIPPFDAETRPYQGAAGEGVAVDADGNVFAAEGPNSLRFAGGAFTKYAVAQ
jgi:DNA-binding beta-propeller fold protein YncE